jgi:hypothetical protein
MKRPILVGILMVAAILAVIIYSSLNLAAYRVEVCMAFNGRTNCRTASGSTEDFALRSARTNACAAIASGVTETIACESATPAKVTWLKR